MLALGTLRSMVGMRGSHVTLQSQPRAIGDGPWCGRTLLTEVISRALVKTGTWYRGKAKSLIL